MDQEHGFSYSLQYLQTRLQALTTFGNPITSISTSCNTEEADLTAVEATETQEAQASTTAELENTTNTTEPVPPVQRKRRLTIPKASTSFQLAHPPPATKHKQRFKVRPKVLLQLRQITENRSPIPTLEVLPSVVCATRLVRRLPRIINGRTGLGPDDLIVVNSQNYEASEKGDRKGDEGSDEENNDTREVVAAICTPAKGECHDHARCEISFAEGSSWTGSSLNNGVYEFTSTNEVGLTTTARWVPRNGKHKRKGSYSPASSTGNLHERRLSEKSFKFSILNPHARRHPVIGSMDRHTIDVLDQYVIPLTPAVTPVPPSPTCESATTHHSQHSYFPDLSTIPGAVLETDDQIRKLILVSGIWVAFVEGWSDAFKYEDDAGLSTSSANGNSPSKGRTLSGRRDNGNGSRAPTPQSNGSGRSRHSGFKLLHRPTASSGQASTSQTRSKPPKRAQSAGPKSPGVAFVQRAKKNANAGTQRATPENSCENLPLEHTSVSGQRNYGAATATTPLRRSHSRRSSNDEEKCSLREGALASDATDSNRRRSDSQRSRSDDSHRGERIEDDPSEVAVGRSKSRRKKPGKVNRFMDFINRKTHRDRRQ